MKKILSRPPRGFTIVELLLYLGILSIFLGVLTQILHSSLDVQLESAGASSADLVSAFLISRFNYDIHRATSITTPAAAGQSDSILVLTIGGVSYTYQVSNSRLTLINNLGVDFLSDSTISVSDFLVTRLGAGSPTETVRVSYTLTSTTATTSGQPQSRSVLFTVGTR